jgi:hypothetical protein
MKISKAILNFHFSMLNSHLADSSNGTVTASCLCGELFGLFGGRFGGLASQFIVDNL